jgi:beta-lactamase regulating signal transducer with metallopeptidase domain
MMSDRVTADARRAKRLLVLRLLPAAGALIVSLLLFLPAHLWLEPPNPGERLGMLPLTGAAIGLLLFIRSAWRVAAVVWSSSRLAALPSLQRRSGDHTQWIEMPVLRGIVLAGVFRPRVLVGAAARGALTDDELEVAVAHEVAHQRAGDNLSRALIRCAPDMFGLTPSGVRIERLWEAEAECLADARAAAGRPVRAASLASALVKVARLARDCSEPGFSQAWSTFHQPRLLETRIRLLVAEQRTPAATGRVLTWLTVAVVSAIGLAWSTGLPHELHQLTEMVISSAF